MEGVSGHAGPDHALSAAADRARDDYLHPQLFEFMLSWWCDQVSVTLYLHMEYQTSGAANTAPVRELIWVLTFQGHGRQQHWSPCWAIL
jgi:hypothetical protein